VNHKEQQGYVTIAQNSDTVNYLELAYLQALNIKATQRHNRYAVLVDQETRQQLQPKHEEVFDYIIDIPTDLAQGHTWKLANEYQVFWLTPFKETIKLESDLLFTRSVDHWWSAFRLKNVCLSTGAKNFKQELSAVRRYRKVFDDNDLPDIYNGLMYFRFSQEAYNFFTTAKSLYENWEEVRTTLLINCHEATPSTDVLYALTAKIVGIEDCTAPSLDFVNFVHMKSGFNGWSDTFPWTETVVHERDGDVIRINNLNQYDAIHYHDKEYASRELIEYYESRRN